MFGARMSEESIGRREIISKVLGSATLLAATAANADIDYAGVGFLGGSSTIDVNNANIRVYTKVSGSQPPVRALCEASSCAHGAASVVCKGVG